jgi:hypothetical protein
MWLCNDIILPTGQGAKIMKANAGVPLSLAVFLLAGAAAEAAPDCEHLGGPPPPLNCDSTTKWCTSIYCEEKSGPGGGAVASVIFPMPTGWKRAGRAEGVVQWLEGGAKGDITIMSTPGETGDLSCRWWTQGDPGGGGFPFPNPPRTGGVGGVCRTVGAQTK